MTKKYFTNITFQHILHWFEGKHTNRQHQEKTKLHITLLYKY